MIGAIIGAAASIGGSIYGAVKNAREARKQKRALEEEDKANEAWFMRRYNEDATQRADAQRIFSKTREAVKERNKAAEGTKSVVGGTDESVAATRESNAAALSDAASQIAASAEARKDEVEDKYMANKSNIRRERGNISVQQQANTAAAVQGVAGAAGQIAGALDGGDNGSKSTNKSVTEEAKKIGNEGVFNQKAQDWLKAEREGTGHQYTADEIRAQQEDEARRQQKGIGEIGRLQRGY